MICKNLSVLREILKLSQAKIASHIGTSRQQILKFEHEDAKLTRSILIALITFFSLRYKTARYLQTIGLYKNKFVQSIGFNEHLISFVIEQNLNGEIL